MNVGRHAEDLRRHSDMNRVGKFFDFCLFDVRRLFIISFQRTVCCDLHGEKTKEREDQRARVLFCLLLLCCSFLSSMSLHSIIDLSFFILLFLLVEQTTKIDDGQIFIIIFSFFFFLRRFF